MEDGASFFCSHFESWVHLSKTKKKPKRRWGFFFINFFLLFFFMIFLFFYWKSLNIPGCLQCARFAMDSIPPLVVRLFWEHLRVWSCWLRGSLGIVRRKKTKQNKKKPKQKRQNSKILSAPLLFIHGLLRPTGEGNCMAGKIKACAQRGQGYF